MRRTPTVRAGQRSEENQIARAQSRGDRASKIQFVRSGMRSGLFAGVAALVSLGRVRRALREGSSERAIRQATMAVFWLGVAMTQWGLNR